MIYINESYVILSGRDVAFLKAGGAMTICQANSVLFYELELYYYLIIYVINEKEH